MAQRLQSLWLVLKRTALQALRHCRNALASGQVAFVFEIAGAWASTAIDTSPVSWVSTLHVSAVAWVKFYVDKFPDRDTNPVDLVHGR